MSRAPLEGDMDTETFRRLGEDLFGNGWQSRMARALGVDGSTVRRWIGSTMQIPPQISAYLRMMAQRQEARGALVFERQALGTPIAIRGADEKRLEWMQKRLVFPGVDQAKPMPSIHTVDEGGVIAVELSSGTNDTIGARDIGYILTRHPDSRHLAGYADAARLRGHDPVIATHRFHHYSVIVHGKSGEIVHQIATHAGNLRTMWSTCEEPAVILRDELTCIPGADAGNESGPS